MTTNTKSAQRVLGDIRFQRGTHIQPSDELRSILETKHKASGRYQRSNGVDFQLTFDEYLAVIGPWRMAQMDKKLKRGEFKRFMDGAFGYVLTWKDKASKDGKVMSASTAIFVNREQAKRALQLKKGDKQTEQGKQRISAYRKGQKASDETRRKMSDARKGVPKTDEQRRKMSEAKRGRKMSDEQKAKIAAGQARRHAERRAAKEASNG